MLPPGARKDALGRGICANPWKSVQARLTEWPLSEVQAMTSLRYHPRHAGEVSSLPDPLHHFVLFWGWEQVYAERIM